MEEDTSTVTRPFPRRHNPVNAIGYARCSECEVSAAMHIKNNGWEGSDWQGSCPNGCGWQSVRIIGLPEQLVNSWQRYRHPA